MDGGQGGIPSVGDAGGVFCALEGKGQFLVGLGSSSIPQPLDWEFSVSAKLVSPGMPVNWLLRTVPACTSARLFMPQFLKKLGKAALIWVSQARVAAVEEFCRSSIAWVW